MCQVLLPLGEADVVVVVAAVAALDVAVVVITIVVDVVTVRDKRMERDTHCNV
jgi:hypothetical protein